VLGVGRGLRLQPGLGLGFKVQFALVWTWVQLMLGEVLRERPSGSFGEARNPGPWRTEIRLNDEETHLGAGFAKSRFRLCSTLRPADDGCTEDFRGCNSGSSPSNKLTILWSSLSDIAVMIKDVGKPLSKSKCWGPGSKVRG